MTSITSKIRFDKAGYYFTGLIILVFLGFWSSYFSKFFNGTNDLSFYFHFHAIMMSLWILILIAQPILIRKKKLAIHKFIGKLTYILMPILCISILLLVHSRKGGKVNDSLGIDLFVTFKDLLIMGTAYIIAIRYRRDINIHARAMIATGIVLIEPALFRFFNNSIINDVPIAYLSTIAILYSLLIGLIIIERKQKSGRWVFPLILGLYIIVHSILIFQIRIGLWETFAEWFVGLPLT